VRWMTFLALRLSGSTNRTAGQTDPTPTPWTAARAAAWQAWARRAISEAPPVASRGSLGRSPLAGSSQAG
jgi:hypothetical protein